MIIVSFIYFLIACCFLTGSGYLVVKSLVKIARHYRWRGFIIAFFIIGIATSLPELFVAVISAWNQIPALSLGNVIGGNIVDLTIVIGLAAILGKKVKFETEIEKRDLLYTTAIIFLPIILFLDQQLSRIDGVILLSAFFLYLARLYYRRKKFEIIKDGVLRKEIPKYGIIFIVSLIVLLLSARFIVDIASEIATELLFPPILVGLLIVAIGTSLPELSFESQAVLKKQSGLALGDLLGSLVANSTLVLGLASIIYPIEAYFPSFIIGSIFLGIIILVFNILARTGKELSRKEGFILLILYVLFVITSLLIR